jgi:hypothetical protein
MRNLRERVEQDLGTTMESPNQWGLPVELTAPDGKVYKTSKNSPDPDNPLPLYGQVLRNTTRESLDGPGLVVTHSPAVSLRISSLDQRNRALPLNCRIMYCSQAAPRRLIAP